MVRWVGVVVGPLRGWDSVLQELERVAVVEVVLKGLRFGCRSGGVGRMAGVEGFGLRVRAARLVEAVVRRGERD